MPKEINTIDEFQQHVYKMLKKPSERNVEVLSVMLKLAGVIMLYKDPGVPLTIWGGQERIGHPIRVQMGQQRYVFRYDSAKKSIDMLQGSLQGNNYVTFSSDTSIRDLIDMLYVPQ